MYFILIIFALFAFLIFKKFLTPNKNLTLEFQNDDKKIILNNMNFYDKNHNLLLRIPKNPNKNKIVLNENESKNLNFSFYSINYEYIIIYYIYNNNIYKYRISNNLTNIKFPFYTNDQYKKYVYINKIKKVTLDNIVLNDYEKHIIPFLGPNYNFYDELNYFISPKNILDYFNIKYKDSSIFNLYDKFENYSSFNINDKLYWNPKLKL